MLSEFNVNTSGENTDPEPFVNWIGIELPENSIIPVVAGGMVYVSPDKV
jgi:hypothetical protein